MVPVPEFRWLGLGKTRPSAVPDGTSFGGLPRVLSLETRRPLLGRVACGKHHPLTDLFHASCVAFTGSTITTSPA